MKQLYPDIAGYGGAGREFYSQFRPAAGSEE